MQTTVAVLKIASDFSATLRVLHVWSVQLQDCHSVGAGLWCNDDQIGSTLSNIQFGHSMAAVITFFLGHQIGGLCKSGVHHFCLIQFRAPTGVIVCRLSDRLQVISAWRLTVQGDSCILMKKERHNLWRAYCGKMTLSWGQDDSKDAL